MAGNIEILGIDNLRAQFSKLKSDMISRTSRRMVASAGGVLRKEAKAIAQSLGLKRSGAMIRNIAIKRERDAGNGVQQYNLGVRHGRHLGRKAKKYLSLSSRTGRVVTRRENDPYYWRFLEFDTKHRRGTSFIQQALINKKNEAIAAMNDRLVQDIEKASKG